MRSGVAAGLAATALLALCSGAAQAKPLPFDDEPLPSPGLSRGILAELKYGPTDFRNYMGYADDTCINHFTPQQYGRVHAWVNYRLKTWLSAGEASPLPTVVAKAPVGQVATRQPVISDSFSQPMDRANV